MGTEFQALLDDHADHRVPDGRHATARNNHQPERTIQTDMGNMSVRWPKTRDRCGAALRFHSVLFPLYLGSTRSVEASLPWAYLKATRTGDLEEALAALLGEGEPSLSAGTLSRPKPKWRVEYDVWHRRDPSVHRYLYWRADRVQFNLQRDETRAFLRVAIDVLPDFTKEFAAIDDSVRESTQSWYGLLVHLRDHPGLTNVPRMVICDGAAAHRRDARLCKSRHDVAPGNQSLAKVL